MKIKIITKKVKLADIKLNAENPRTITKENMARLVKSIVDFPEMLQMREIVVDETMTVLGGNMRTLALRDAGVEEVTAKICTGLTARQKREFVIKDNSTFGSWDMESLAKSWADEPLAAWGMDLPDEWMAQDKDVQEDDFDAQGEAEKIVEPISRMGDIWLLGKHRVMCGDSTNMEDVGLLMGKTKATLLFTDPPYGVSIGKKNAFLKSMKGSSGNVDDLAMDDMRPAELGDMLLKAMKLCKTSMSDDCSVFVCSPQGGGLGMMMMMMMKDAGLEVRHILNWVKNSPTFSMGRLDYDYQHEPILFTWNKTHKRYRKGAFQTSVWKVDKPRSNKEHPTMKPVDLPACAILNHTDERDIVMDLFLGSGTTLMACEQLGRICYGMEIAPVYCDVIVKRWEEFTGGKAVLETQ